MAVLAGFSIPVSTALLNISFGFLVLSILLTPATRSQIGHALRQPFVMGCLAFYLAFALGMLWTPVPFAASFGMLVKMRAYLLVPVVFAGCLLIGVRRGLLLGFAAGTLLSVVLSIASGFLKHPILMGAPGDYAVFRTHTYHNTFICFLMCGIAAFGLAGRIPPRYRMLAVVVLVLCVVDVFFLVSGRTAQGVLAMLLAALLLLWNIRKGVLGLVGLALIGSLLYLSSGMLKQEVQHIQYDIAQRKQGVLETGNYENSLGLRLYFWHNAAALVEEAPLIGHGTGSYQHEILDSYGKLGGQNPHNDYLWTTVELGLLGLVAMLAMLGTGAVQAMRLNPPERWAALLLLSGYVLSSLLNSFFTDNITGSAFALLTCAALAGRWFDAGQPERRERRAP